MPLNLPLLISLRAKRKLSQQALATAIGMNRVNYNRIEVGKNPPTLANLEAIAKALGVKPGKLIQ